jgi:hypothetical protein
MWVRVAFDFAGTRSSLSLNRALVWSQPMQSLSLQKINLARNQELSDIERASINSAGVLKVRQSRYSTHSNFGAYARKLGLIISVSLCYPTILRKIIDHQS